MSSNNIYKPTWLYIKQHNQTGLKYFGKTVQDPLTYKGSGVYWNDHLRVHGDDVTTVWTKLFESEDEITAYAQQFSKENDIVKSDAWANLIDEDGKTGGKNPVAWTDKARAKRKSTLLARTKPLPNNNTADTIKKANQSRAETYKRKKELGIPHRGPDKQPRKSYTWHKPFVNRNSPESLAKRAMTLANKPLLVCPHCGKESKSESNMKRFHFDKCKLATFGDNHIS